MNIPAHILRQVVDNIKKTPHNKMVKRLQDAENSTLAKNVNTHIKDKL